MCTCGFSDSQSPKCRSRVQKSVLIPDLLLPPLAFGKPGSDSLSVSNLWFCVLTSLAQSRNTARVCSLFWRGGVAYTRNSWRLCFAPGSPRTHCTRSLQLELRILATADSGISKTQTQCNLWQCILCLFCPSSPLCGQAVVISFPVTPSRAGGILLQEWAFAKVHCSTDAVCICPGMCLCHHQWIFLADWNWYL